jgi:hypothetical protein
MAVILDATIVGIDLVPAYKPISFYVINSVSNGVVQISADIYINGTLAATVYSDKIVTDFGGGFFGFLIDVSAPIRDNLTYKLLASGTGNETADDKAQARVTVNIFEWYVDSGTNLLTKNVVFVAISDLFISLNATRQGNELISLARHLQGSGTMEGIPFTNRPSVPENIKMKIGESEFLGIYADTATHYMVLCYNSSGIAFRGGIRSMSFTVHGGIRSNATRQIGVGAENINNSTFSTWFNGLPLPLIDDQVKKYIVGWGVPITIFGLELFQGSFMTYAMGERCDTRRFHWMNRYGLPDSYSFQKFTDLTQESSPDRYEKPLINTVGGGAIITPSYSSRGISILKSDNELNFEVESFVLNELECRWIAEMASSPEVFIEDKDYLGNIINVPVVMEKNKVQLIEDEDTGFHSVKMKGSYARMIESQTT